MWWRSRDVVMRRVRVRRTDSLAFAPSPFRGEGRGEGRVLAGTLPSLAVTPAQAGVQFLYRLVLALSRPGRLRSGRSDLLPEAGSLSLACPRESNQREGHPIAALAGRAGQCVRVGRAFRRGSCPGEKCQGSFPGTPAGPVVRPSPPLKGARRSKAQSRRLVQLRCTSRRMVRQRVHVPACL